MNTKYVAPSIEIIEVEVEDAVLSMSLAVLDEIGNGGNAWN